MLLHNDLTVHNEKSKIEGELVISFATAIIVITMFHSYGININH